MNTLGGEPGKRWNHDEQVLYYSRGRLCCDQYSLPQMMMAHEMMEQESCTKGDI